MNFDVMLELLKALGAASWSAGVYGIVLAHKSPQLAKEVFAGLSKLWLMHHRITQQKKKSSRRRRRNSFRHLLPENVSGHEKRKK